MRGDETLAKQLVQLAETFTPTRTRPFFKMNSRPYLDKLVTSPHVPKQPGQTGYCSRKLIPDLTCTGIHSEFEPKTDPVTTADGRMTKVFVLNAYRTMRELQRGITKQNAQEEIFRIDHRQYIDKLLVDMEEEKKDKHERRMRHFKRTKDSMGFAGSFESAFGENTSSWAPVSAKGGQIQAGDFNDTRSQNASPVPGSDQGETAAVPRSAKNVRINESPQEFLSRPTTDGRTWTMQESTKSAYSLRSAGSNNSGIGFPSQPSPSKNQRKHSRMALFNSLLDTVEPPKSPVKRFGSMSLDSLNNTGSSSQFVAVPFDPASASMKSRS
jgi:hypothetical protein